MNENRKTAAPPGLGLHDVLHVVFRHKWMIVAGCGMGIAGALALPFVIHPNSQSEARLLIKYVMEAKAPPQVGDKQSVVQPRDDGQSVLNTEVEILTSMDLALQVADAIGPEKVMAKAGGGTNRDQAAAVIQNPKNLVVTVPKSGNVIRITFQHGDPSIVQPVLNQLIESYIQIHAAIHRGGGFDDFLTGETDKLRSRLQQTEAELRKAKNELGVISLDQAKKVYGDQMAQLKQKLLDAQAELAEREAAANELAGLLQRPPAEGTNALPASNSLAVSPEKIAEYKRVCGLLETLGKREQELLVTFTPSNSQVQELQGRILQNEQLKKRLEDQNPGLREVRVAEPKTLAADPSLGTRVDPLAARVEVTALRSKIKVLIAQLEEVQKNVTALGEADGTISELQRQRDLEEGYYKNFAESLEQSHISERLGAGKVSNISIIQAPTAPAPVASKLRKMMAMVLLGCVGAAFGLAFLIELYLDRSIKHPGEIQTKIGLPLFITIPRLSLNGKSRGLRQGKKVRLLAQRVEDKSPDERGLEPTAGAELALPDPAERVFQSTEIAPWDPAHGLRPFSEALRDRLITYFEVNGLTHKPKLVALTSCGEGSGVSTVAAGLAASLSETGEGNVLLVDMNVQNGAARHFHRGDLACGIDDALGTQKRDNALVQENLYVVSESTNSDKLPSVLPKRFKNLVPRLKASDFDYIIFDMPSVSQISITPRLARFMDMVLMVVESGKTDQELVKKASSLLADSKANVGVVLNKNRSYVPKRLQQEL